MLHINKQSKSTTLHRQEMKNDRIKREDGLHSRRGLGDSNTCVNGRASNKQRAGVEGAVMDSNESYCWIKGINIGNW